MISLSTVMKVLGERKAFIANHPDFFGFVLDAFKAEMTEGTVIEMRIKKPGEEAVTKDVCIQESDEKLMSAISELIHQIVK